MLNEISVKFVDCVTDGVCLYLPGEVRTSWLKYEASSEVSFNLKLHTFL